jgi:hypothetical protein
LTGIRKLGAITPLGGLCFLTGWLLVVIQAFQGHDFVHKLLNITSDPGNGMVEHIVNHIGFQPFS